MPKTIALVACVSQKHTRQMPAGQLYCSDWFVKASAYARQAADEWYILSAKYGLLPPNQVIGPYNETLNEMSAGQHRQWAQKVSRELEQRVSAGDRVVVLAGSRYREGILPVLQRLGCQVEVPMEGLRIGEQLGWLKSRLEGRRR